MPQLEQNQTATHPKEPRVSTPLNAIALLISLLAVVACFLPFALNTSPWNALTLRVPGNQGNWWHALIGAPFFLSLPMIWLRLRAFSSTESPASAACRIIWSAISLSACGTLLVETPFLLHRAGTSELQRLAVIFTGLGVIIASAAYLLRHRRDISPTRALIIGLNTAYIANAALCLIVYASAPGPVTSRSGWLLTMVLVWPMALELLWIFTHTSGPQKRSA